MPLRPGSSGKGLGWVYGRFQVQVLMGTKRKKKKKMEKKKAIKKIKNKNSKHILADEWFGKTMEEKLQHTSK